jgi:hypothetical protein
MLGTGRSFPPLHTKIAFVHHSPAIELGNLIGTGIPTDAAPDADLLVHDNNAVPFPLDDGPGRAFLNTGRILAVPADQGKELPAYIRIRAFPDLLDYNGPNTRLKVVDFFAGQLAGPALDAPSWIKAYPGVAHCSLLVSIQHPSKGP